jgi:Protein of unknown function (DUF4236)
MGFRFRRSFRVLPGIRLNLSRSGVSASFGVRGAHVTLGPRGTTTSVGLPGTGLSYTSHIPLKGSDARPPGQNIGPLPPALTATSTTEEPDGNQTSVWSVALIFAALFLLSFSAVFFLPGSK